MVAEHHHLLALLSDELEIAVESGLQNGILQVRQLVADGKVNDGVGNSLESKLDAAAKQLDRGKIIPAVNQLESLLREPNALVRSGRLTAGDVSPRRGEGEKKAEPDTVEANADSLGRRAA